MRRVVIDGFGGHRPDQADLIDDRTNLRKQLTYLGAVAAELFETMLWSKTHEFLPLQLRDLFSFRERLGHRLAVQLRQPGFVIERLQVRRTARHAEPNHPFYFLRIIKR